MLTGNSPKTSDIVPFLFDVRNYWQRYHRYWGRTSSGRRMYLPVLCPSSMQCWNRWVGVSCRNDFYLSPAPVYRAPRVYLNDANSPHLMMPVSYIIPRCQEKVISNQEIAVAILFWLWYKILTDTSPYSVYVSFQQTSRSCHGIIYYGKLLVKVTNSCR